MARTKFTFVPGYYGYDRKAFELKYKDYVRIALFKPDWCVERIPMGQICGRKVIDNQFHICVWMNIEKRIHITRPFFVEYVCRETPTGVGTSSEDPIILDDEDE